jgi:transcriptional regulator with XRE-family HTH domain
MELNPVKVREALARAGKSQADLSRLTGWSEAKVSRYVTGKNLGEVTLTNLKELAAALDVSAAALVELEDVAQTDAEKRLLRNFRAATDRDKGLAQAQVEPREPLR